MKEDKIYGYSTKAFNQQVKNNIERFDEDFRFQLSDAEVVYDRVDSYQSLLNVMNKYSNFPHSK